MVDFGACVKCGGDVVRAQYHIGCDHIDKRYCHGCHHYDCKGGVDEHLKVTCQQCSYKWYRQTADAKGQADDA